MKKKKVIKIVIIALIVAVVGFLLYKVGIQLRDKVRKNNINDITWLRENISIEKDEKLGSDIYSVNKPDYVEIYNLKYQQVINEKISELIDDNEDILILNPYGTNELGINIYFETKEESKVSYTISVSQDEISDFSRTLKNYSEDNYIEKHEYQIIGLVPGYKNTLRIAIEDREGNKEEKKYTIDMSDVEVHSETVLESEDGESTESLSNGLYATLGNDSDLEDYLSLYDNDGIVRTEIPIIGYRAHAILFKEDKMYFSISQGRIAEVNNLGEVTKVFTLGKYQLHHDYVFDEDGNLLVLANNTEKSTEEDCIIKVDLETEEVTEVIDFEDMFASYVETCELDTTSTRDEGEDGLDWLHLNSIELVDGDVILSSRETSSIIKVRDIYGDQELVYILGSKEFWKDTEFIDYVYSQVGDFTLQGGQHSVRYFEGEEDGVYYLTFYNNNYGKSNSQPNFDFSTIDIKNNNPYNGDKSYYYTYKVNENEKTFELTDSFSVPYSGIVSSVQILDNENVVVDSGTKGIFGEYDKDHKLIKKFTVKMNKYMVYRVLKYDFNNFWFEEGN